MEFPVIVLKEKDNMIYYYKKKKDLLKTTEELALRKKVFDRTTIIDSEGYAYKVKGITKSGYVGFFGLNPLLKNWWSDREIKIELEFEPNIEKIELSALKQIALEKVEKSKRFWSEAWDIEDLKKAINDAITFESLIGLFR
ncbi:MAG TPA: hypothetical protein VFR70_10520 [Flavobacterium sp.]|nr:hypothetical protein [Flavobacterium sp.]